MRGLNIFVYDNVIENVVSKLAAILFRPQRPCANLSPSSRIWHILHNDLTRYNIIWHDANPKLEQLERLRSEDTPAASWLPTLLSHLGSQVKTRSNDLEDIGQGQRSSHATHLLMLVIICTKYGKNPSRTVDPTERTQFSRSRPNNLDYPTINSLWPRGDGSVDLGQQLPR